MKILVVEDEQKVAAFIRSGLEENGYSVDLAYDGFLGEKMVITQDYHLILLDINIPAINGIELCRKIREQKPNIPVLMLTALGTTADKIAGFEAGADDYLVKPFEFEELLARIKALTKRMSQAPYQPANSFLTIGDLRLDLDRKIAHRGDKSIPLTAKEFDLLEYFMRNTGRVISKPELAEKVWDINFDTGTNVVEVYINILRKKIDKGFETRFIHTRIGLGYMLSNEP